MNAEEAPWGELLGEATERVRLKLSEVVLRGERATFLGTGASGDRTLVADHEAEEELLRALAKVSGLKVVSEEAGHRGDPKAKHVALVDPLDGSSNFERGIPFYCSSVAIANGRRLEDVTHALVRDLFTGDVFAAEKGRGATKNGRRIFTSREKDPSSAIVGIDISMADPKAVRRLEPLISAAKRQVHFGANALELCFLADGRIDASVDLRGRIRITDFAAGYLIAKEAGATVSGDGSRGLRPSFDLEHRFSYFATANPALHGKVLQLCGGTSGSSRRRTVSSS